MNSRKRGLALRGTSPLVPQKHNKFLLVLLVVIVFLVGLSSFGLGAICEFTDEYKDLESGKIDSYLRIEGNKLIYEWIDGSTIEKALDKNNYVITGIGWDTDDYSFSDIGFEVAELNKDCSLKLIDKYYYYNSRSDFGEIGDYHRFLRGVEAFVGQGKSNKYKGVPISLLEHNGDEFVCAIGHKAVPKDSVIVGWGGGVEHNNWPVMMAMDVWNLSRGIRDDAILEAGLPAGETCETLDTPELFIGTGKTNNVNSNTYSEDIVPLSWIMTGLGIVVNDGKDDLVGVKLKIRKLLIDVDEDGVWDNPDVGNPDQCVSWEEGEVVLTDPDDVFTEGRLAGCTCEQIKKDKDNKFKEVATCEPGIEGTLSEKTCGDEELKDLGDIRSDEEYNEYICLKDDNDLVGVEGDIKDFGWGSTTVVEGEEGEDEITTTCGDWCWVNANSNANFHIYTIKEPMKVPYEVVSNNNYWFECSGSQGTKEISSAENIVNSADIEKANKFYCYWEGNRWSWAQCGEIDNVDNGIKERGTGDGLFKLKIDEEKSTESSKMIDLDYSSFYRDSRFDIKDYDTMEFIVEFVSEDIALPADVSLTIFGPKKKEGRGNEIYFNKEILSYATNNPLIEKGRKIHVEVPIPEMLGVTGIKIDGGDNDVIVSHVYLNIKGRKPLICSEETSDDWDESVWFNSLDFWDNKDWSAKDMCTKTYGEEAWLGGEEVTVDDRRCCGNDANEYYSGDSKEDADGNRYACWNSQVVGAGNTTMNVEFGVDYWEKEMIVNYPEVDLFKWEVISESVTTCQLCRRYADNNKRGSASWECVNFGQELQTDFVGDVGSDDDFDLKVENCETDIKRACQLCRRYADNNKRGSASWECVNFGQELQTDFVGDVGSDDDFDLKVECGDSVLSGSQLCRRYADRNGRSSASWECVNFGQELQTDFVGDVDGNDDFDLKVEPVHIAKTEGQDKISVLESPKLIADKFNTIEAEVTYTLTDDNEKVETYFFSTGDDETTDPKDIVIASFLEVDVSEQIIDKEPENFIYTCNKEECIYPLPGVVVPEENKGITITNPYPGLYELWFKDEEEEFPVGSNKEFFTSGNLIAKKVPQQVIFDVEEDDEGYVEEQGFYGCQAANFLLRYLENNELYCSVKGDKFCAHQDGNLINSWSSSPLTRWGYKEHTEELGEASEEIEFELIEVEEPEEGKLAKDRNHSTKAVPGRNFLPNAEFTRLDRDDLVGWDIGTTGGVNVDEREFIDNYLEDGTITLYANFVLRSKVAVPQNKNILFTTDSGSDCAILRFYDNNGLLIEGTQDFFIKERYNSKDASFLILEFEGEMDGCEVKHPMLQLIDDLGAEDFSYKPEDEIKRRGAACCPRDWCWNGYVCVKEMSALPYMTEKVGEERNYRCIAGEWKHISLQYDWNFDEWGFCSNEDQCFVQKDGNAGAEPEDVYVSGQFPICVNNGEFIFDHYCNGGSWTSRTKFLALELLKNYEDDDFVLYCTDPLGALVELEELENDLILGEGTAMTMAADVTGMGGGEVNVCFGNVDVGKDKLVKPEENTCVNSICVLKSEDGTVLATSLNDNSFLEALGIILDDLDSVCSGEGFVECDLDLEDDAELWYSSELKAVVYGKEGIKRESFFGEAWDWIADFLGLGESSGEGTEDISEEELTEIDFGVFMGKAMNFNNLFLLNKGEKKAAAKQELFKDKKILTAQYDNFETPICEYLDRNRINLPAGVEPSVIEPDVAVCEEDDNIKVQKVTITAGFDFFWPQLTGKLRVEVD